MPQGDSILTGDIKLLPENMLCLIPSQLLLHKDMLGFLPRSGNGCYCDVYAASERVVFSTCR